MKIVYFISSLLAIVQFARADLPEEIFYGSQLEVEFHIPGPFNPISSGLPSNGLRISVGYSQTFEIDGFTLAAAIPPGNVSETDVGIHLSSTLVDQAIDFPGTHLDISDAS